MHESEAPHLETHASELTITEQPLAPPRQFTPTTTTTSTSHFAIPGKASAFQQAPQTSPIASLVEEPLKPAEQEHLPVLIDAEPYPPATKPLPYNLQRKLELVHTSAGKAFAVILDSANPFALPIRSKKLNAILCQLARNGGGSLSKHGLAELNDALEAHAEQYGEETNVWLRIAPIEGGIEIDVGDDAHTRIRITAGKVELISSCSDTVFNRTVNIRPMVIPAETGNWRLLEKYLNVATTDKVLLIAWITYVLAHPKVPSSKYPILVLQGNEGSGKSSLCKNIIIRIIDPSELGVQVFPKNATDLAIAGQNAHVLCFDNLRGFRHNMADILCIAATGGTITSRQLYTDADQQAIRLHVPLVLNGIHSFIDTPDLAQRCLPIQLIALDKSKRKPEEELTRELEVDLPAIMRGLFDLIASIFKHLPNVEITNPERMIDFVAWLAAMEMADDVPAGIYQELYSHTLQQGQLDTLMDNPLAAAILELAEADDWSGTPADLLSKLNMQASLGTQRSREWPQNPISLSKRIAGLQAGLLSQSVRIELSRGKQRTVTITKLGAAR